MKVLLISPCILPVPAVKGGAVLTLLESLIKRNETDKRMELTVVGSFHVEAARKASELYPNTSFIFLNKKKGIARVDQCIDAFVNSIKKNDKRHEYIWKLYVVFRLRKILREQEFDKVVFQNSGYLLNVLKDKRILEKYQNKLFYHLHNDIPDNVYIEGVKACKLILVSQYLKRKIDTLCGCDMNSQIRIVKNGLDTKQFERKLSAEEKTQIKNALGIRENKKIILYAGRIIERKGIGQLLEAFLMLNRRELVLLIIGSHNFGSGQTAKFETKLKRTFDALREQVIFTGYVPYDEMWKYYQLADIGVFPSMWEEPAGLTMIEAAATGIPVITTISGGIPEYLKNDLALFVKRDDGIIDHIADAIENVLDNPEKWSEIATQAKRYVQKNFSEEILYNNFVNVLQERI